MYGPVSIQLTQSHYNLSTDNYTGIVVDDIVYDCTDFVKEHPGGDQIIRSFGGDDCSWQFWRFHGRKEMEKFGKQFRVGRTKGMVNKFEEPVRYVGLRKLGDNWD